jgi:ADP-L-glycero-D-manno-heptose 6-epimerase
LNNMKALVTGGAGFIGSNLALELEKNGHSVTALDNLYSGNLDNLKGFKGKFIQGDTSDSKLQTIGKFDAIFHQAAITDPRHDDDKETYTKNVEGFRNILKLAQKSNSKVVYASTANLYGNGKIPMKEDQEKEIISAYGKSKLEMDNISEKLFGKMHIVGLRYFNVFGPREKYKGRPASMIYHLRNQMKSGRNPRLFKHGEQVRDHIYVKDTVLANLLALDAPSGVYNVGTGIGTSFNEVVKVLNEVLGTKLAIEYFDNPYDLKTYQANTQADTKKAEKYLRFKAKYSFMEGVKDYHNYLSEEGN